MAIADWLDIELFTVRRLQDRALGDSACDYVHRLMCGMSYVCRMARSIQDRPAALRTDAMVLVNEARSTTQLATLRAGARFASFRPFAQGDRRRTRRVCRACAADRLRSQAATRFPRIQRRSSAITAAIRSAEPLPV